MDYGSKQIRAAEAQRKLLISLDNKSSDKLGMHIWRSSVSPSQEHQNLKICLSAECMFTVQIHSLCKVSVIF